MVFRPSAEGVAAVTLALWMVLTFMLLSFDSAAWPMAGLRRGRRECVPDRMVVFALGKTVAISPRAAVGGYKCRPRERGGY